MNQTTTYLLTVMVAVITVSYTFLVPQYLPVLQQATTNISIINNGEMSFAIGVWSIASLIAFIAFMRSAYYS